MASHLTISDEIACVLKRLRDGRRIKGRTLVLVAHPDDETLGMGLSLHRLDELVLAHLTDGAPQTGEDWRKAGFASRDAYRQTRADELEKALHALGVDCRRHALGVPDQSSAYALVRLTLAAGGLLAQADHVFTHAYEGGHPDHNSAAFVVQIGCSLLARKGLPPPARLEFVSYHARGGARVTGMFWPDDRACEASPHIDEIALSRKRAALACYRSQADVIGWFNPLEERYRAAPRYDFTQPPPPGAALYDDFGWPITSELWRSQAQAALDQLAWSAPTICR